MAKPASHDYLMLGLSVAVMFMRKLLVNLCIVCCMTEMFLSSSSTYSIMAHLQRKILSGGPKLTFFTFFLSLAINGILWVGLHPHLFNISLPTNTFLLAHKTQK